MCVRMTPSPRSIAKVPSGRVLPGTPDTAPHWYVFLLMMMMIAFITFKSSLVPLFEGL